MRKKNFKPIWCLPILLISACASYQPEPMARPEIPPPEMRPVIILTEEDQLDIELTRALINPISEQDLDGSEDPVAWITAWWEGHDPTPGTYSNEAFDVFKQRAVYLHDRFPDVSLSDIPEPWNSFLLFGYWDEILIGNQFIRMERFRRYQSDRRREGVDLSTVDRLQIMNVAATQILIYQVPEPFHISILREKVIEGGRGLIIPSLEGAWDLLENPEADAEQRKNALKALSWYELPEIADRLLNIPETLFTDLPDELDECLRRLTVRRAYCLGTKGAQRLAVITAAGAGTAFQLSRTLASEYPISQFFADLERLTEEYFSNRQSDFRGLHPALRNNPTALLNKLELQFYSESSVTGWDWRGDVSLVFGPPNSIVGTEHTVNFIFGYPANYRVASGTLGTVDAVKTQDPVERYVRDLREMIETGRSENRVAAKNLMAMIPEAITVSDSLIIQLNRLIPPSSRRIHHGLAELAINITADVITFPNRDGSIEIFASMGIPYEEVFLQSTPTGIKTRAETSCVLFDGTGELVTYIWHDEGFSVERPEGRTENLYLVDSFNFTTDPGEYILYCSVRDPVSEKATGRLFLLDLQLTENPGPVISPIALAATIESGKSEGIFQRGDYQLLPYPGRSLLFSEEIWLYSEISDLARSEYGSHSWKETYYIIPARANMGIIGFSPGTVHTSLQSHVERYVEVDLSSFEGEYGGPLYIVVLITDVVSGRSALAAAFFRIFRL